MVVRHEKTYFVKAVCLDDCELRHGGIFLPLSLGLWLNRWYRFLNFLQHTLFVILVLLQALPPMSLRGPRIIRARSKSRKAEPEGEGREASERDPFS